ncbi:MAG: hypothetical protein MUC99_08305 [Anaerolineae bacterium]|nr:hypothetical protein [Anaerolineae bacterium]
MSVPPDPQETLDPTDAAGWEALRALGHRMIDEMFDHMQTVRERPVWQPIPPDVKDRIRRQPLPIEPQGAEAAYEAFARDVLGYSVGNTHPRFWGWVIGTGTPLGALADFLAGVMNTRPITSSFRSWTGSRRRWASRPSRAASWSAARRWPT